MASCNACHGQTTVPLVAVAWYEPYGGIKRDIEDNNSPQQEQKASHSKRDAQQQDVVRQVAAAAHVMSSRSRNASQQPSTSTRVPE